MSAISALESDHDDGEDSHQPPCHLALAGKRAYRNNATSAITVRTTAYTGSLCLVYGPLKPNGGFANPGGKADRINAARQTRGDVSNTYRGRSGPSTVERRRQVLLLGDELLGLLALHPVRLAKPYRPTGRLVGE